MLQLINKPKVTMEITEEIFDFIINSAISIRDRRGMFILFSRIDVSTPDKLEALKSWRRDDGSFSGLQKLYIAQQGSQEAE